MKTFPDEVFSTRVALETPQEFPNIDIVRKKTQAREMFISRLNSMITILCVGPVKLIARICGKRDIDYVVIPLHSPNDDQVLDLLFTQHQVINQYLTTTETQDLEPPI